MNRSIIAVGNSRGIRIPKALLEQSGFAKDQKVELRAKQGIIEVVASAPTVPVREVKMTQSVGDGASEVSILSESALAKDWSQPEEDTAWAFLQ